MRKPATIPFLILAFCSCEKEPEELLIGTWKDLQSDVLLIRFHSDGRFSRHYDSDFAIDVCEVEGNYSIHADTLRIEEYVYCTDTTIISSYTYAISKKDLELTNLVKMEVKAYERLK